MRDEDIYRAIGRRLRARRRMLEMSQGQVAARCGLTFQQIQKYEAGMIGMPVARLVALADVLQTPLIELVDGLQTGAAGRRAYETPAWQMSDDDGLEMTA